MEAVIPTANQVTQLAVSFDRPFSSRPNVFLNAMTSAPQNVSIAAGSVTGEGFTIYAYRNSSTQITVLWTAIGE